MNKKRLFSPIFCLFFLGSSLFAIEERKVTNVEVLPANFSKIAIQEELEILNSLLLELCATVGITNSYKDSLPKLVLSPKRDKEIIAYHSTDNKIHVSERFIQFANTTTVAKKELIYIYHLGHELGHYYLFNNKPKVDCHPFMAEEKQADFYGVFTAMLAGYSEIKTEVADILEALYEFFELGKDGCYPPLTERQKTAKTTIEKADSLYQLFHLANHISAINHVYLQPQYEAAVEIYDYLLQHFKGAEFYNNRGILYTHLALQDNYGHKGKWKRYYLPIEMDLKSKLGIIRAPEEGLSDLNTIYFKKALADFNQAIKVNPNRERYYLNKVNTLIFMQQYELASQVLANECWSNGDLKLLLTSIIQINSNKISLGLENLQNLSKRNAGRISLLAKMNLRVHDPDTYPIPATTKNRTISWNKTMEQNISYEAIKQVKKWPIFPASKFQYGWKSSDKKECFFVLFKNHRPILTTQILSKDTPLPSISNFPATTIGHNFESFKITENNEAVLIVLGQEGVLIEEF